MGVAFAYFLWAFGPPAAYLFYQSDPTAGYLMIPTCLWVTVASALNWSIYFRNK